VIFAIVSYLRRKQKIAGWLLCYWIVGVLVISLADRSAP
jgi:hypothetical protein